MKSLVLYNFDENEDRLISEIRKAKELDGRLSICSTLGYELTERVCDALSDLVENMDPTEGKQLLTLALGGCKHNEYLNTIICLAQKQMVLEKICLDDARFVPILEHGMVLQENRNLKEISLCIASSEWRRIEMKSFCNALKTSAPNLECLRLRTWTHRPRSCHDDYYRSDSNMVNTTSWDEGLDLFLEAIVGKKSLVHIQLQVLEMFSLEQKRCMERMLSDPNCRINKLDLRIQQMSDTDHSNIQWLVPGIKQNKCFQMLELSGWKFSNNDKDCLLQALNNCRHLECFKFDTSQLQCDPNQLLMGLLQLDFLKEIDFYSNNPKKDDYDLDMELLMPLIVQTTSLEKINLTGTNFSTNVMNKLLKVLGSCETLRCLKIINVPESSKGDNKSFLEPLNCCNLQQLQLVGFSPFVSKRNLFAYYQERREWFYNALRQNPKLYRFGPGDFYGLTRFLETVDLPLLYMADLNRFGRIFSGKPEYRSLWPLLLAQVNEKLEENSQRQVSTIFGLLSNGYLSSF